MNHETDAHTVEISDLPATGNRHQQRSTSKSKTRHTKKVKWRMVCTGSYVERFGTGLTQGTHNIIITRTIDDHFHII
eukprot:scaffold318981_cov35-Attheya_sp.AAC.1